MDSIEFSYSLPLKLTALVPIRNGRRTRARVFLCVREPMLLEPRAMNPGEQVGGVAAVLDDRPRPTTVVLDGHTRGLALGTLPV